MGVPYTKQQEFQVLAGVATCVRMPTPWRGVLNRFILKQIQGTLGGFTLNIFDRQDACAGVDEDSSNPDDAVLLDPAVHKVIATQTVAGSSDVLELFNYLASYINQDEQNAVSRRPTSALWLEVTSVEDATFNLGYTIDQLTEPSA
jgi:hypothetical protein